MATLAETLRARMTELAHGLNEAATACPGLKPKQIQTFLDGAFPRKHGVGLIAKYLGIADEALLAMKVKGDRPRARKPARATAAESFATLQCYGTTMSFANLEALRTWLTEERTDITLRIMGQDKHFTNLDQVRDLVGRLDSLIKTT